MDAALRDSLVNTLFTLPMTFLLSWFATRMLSFRYKRAYLIAYPLGATAARIALQALRVFGGNLSVISAVELPLILAAVLLTSDDRPVYRLFVPALETALMMTTEAAALLLFSLCGVSVTSIASTSLFSKPFVYLVIRMISLLLFAALLCLMESAWNRGVRKRRESNLLVFLVFPLDQAMFLVFGVVLVIRTNGSRADYLALWLLAAVSLLADLGMVRALKKLRAADEARQKAGFLEEQLRQQRAYYDRILQDAAETAKIRHDIRNQLNTAYALMSGGCGEQTRAILDGIADCISAPQRFCANHVVNAVMNEKAELCRREGIALECDLSVEESGPAFQEVELCSLFANLMDNAINGCRASGEPRPRISLSASRRKGYLVVSCVNTARPKDEPARRPSLAAEHGWGLEILRDIASRHDGRVEVEAGGSQYAAYVFLKISPDETARAPAREV